MRVARHLLSLAPLSRDEILELLDIALLYKSLRARGVRRTRELEGRSVAMIFEKPSTRTRASFAVAVYEMGGLPVVYSRDELQLSRGEPIKDTARVLSRYHDAIAARVYRHEELEELAAYSSVPVVNLLSDRFHPLQALADYMTILEKLGRLERVKLAFVGDGRDNVFQSLAIAGLKLGVEVRVACPGPYAPDTRELERLAGEVRGVLKVYEDPVAAVEGVDVIYTDVIVSMGQESEREQRLRAFLPRYRVTRELLEAAGGDVIFMHCLPARRGEEVEEEVLEGDRSVVFDQAENRLHTAKAVLAMLLKS
ncbi:MAG: ornithine carbamoyltransferase [Thermoprotei archaeon]|nr:MAG: ornithine carbamoyltransferase [Thermoprotei archaeon]